MAEITAKFELWASTKAHTHLDDSFKSTSSARSDEDSSFDEDSDSDEDSLSESSSSLEFAGDDEEFLSMLTCDPSERKIRRSTSMPSLLDLELTPMQLNTMLSQHRTRDSPRCRRASMTGSLQIPTVGFIHVQGASLENVEVPLGMNPSRDLSALYFEILAERGFTPRVIPYDEVKNFFLEVTESRVSAYCLDVITAVKTGDVDFLRIVQVERNRSLNSCNRFGESIIHTACRSGQVDVLRFLIMEANVDIRVMDDFGRNPCHDAAWQAVPNMALVELLLIEWPDLLLISDKRGSTPLQYVRKSQWPVWIDMMEKNRSKFLPKVLIT